MQFFLLFFLFSSSLFAQTINVAVLDTGFDLNKILIPQQVTIKAIKNVTGSQLTTKHLAHGTKVLSTFLQHLHLRMKDRVVIWPIVIFDHMHRQKLSYWQEAVKSIKKLDHLILLSAIGLPVDQLPTITLPISFIAAGQRSINISKSTILFPQRLAKQNKNILLIGNYFPAEDKDDLPMINPNLLNRELIFAYFPTKNGSSIAVAKAAAQALNICIVQFSTLPSCLRSRRFVINPGILSY